MTNPIKPRADLIADALKRFNGFQHVEPTYAESAYFEEGFLEGWEAACETAREAWKQSQEAP